MNNGFKPIRKCLFHTLLILLIFSVGIACSGNSGKLVKNKTVVTGKRVAPISISYEPVFKAEIGEAIDIEITCETLSDVNDLKLKLAPSKGMDMIPETFEAEYGDRPGRFKFSEHVLVIPGKEGFLYLNVFVSGIFGKSRMVRSGAVPVKVGNDPQKQLKSSGKLKTDPKGRRVISMPAEE
jgi:hypothetical protein